MSLSFQDGVIEARPVTIVGTFPLITDSLQLRPGLGVGYDVGKKRLTFEAHLGRHRLEIQGIDCSALEAEAIAADVLQPVPGCGYRQFTPRKNTLFGFATGLPATALSVMMVKVAVGRGEQLRLPANGYFAVFPAVRPQSEHSLFRLRTVIDGWQGDVHLDIVVNVTDLMMALTQVGHFRAISRSSSGGCVVALSTHRLSVDPRSSFAS
jgi:hypothetical protein